MLNNYKLLKIFSYYLYKFLFESFKLTILGVQIANFNKWIKNALINEIDVKYIWINNAYVYACPSY
jgi:hypothetical protein